MSSSGNQLLPAASTVIAEEGNSATVLPGAGLDAASSSEKRDWANLIRDAIRHIAGKLLTVDASEYIRLRAVCKPWRISTDAPSWDPNFFPRNWLILKHDAANENDDVADVAAPPANPPAPHRFVNVRTGATLKIHLPAFEEYGDYIAGAEGLLLFHNACSDTVRVFNPLTRATAILPGLAAGVPPGVEEALELTAAGVVADVNSPVTVIPTVVLVLALQLSTMILCAKPGDEHWGTVDAGVVEVADSEVLPAFQDGLSMNGRFYVPTRYGDVLRVELHPKPHLVYVARPPGRFCRCHAFTSYLVPSLAEDDACEDNDGMLLVRILVGAIDVLGVHFGSGRHTRIAELGNRAIFLPGVTIRADKFPSLPPMEVGTVHLGEDIEDYIVG